MANPNRNPNQQKNQKMISRSKKDLEAEVKAELSMRRKVWKNTPGDPPKFWDPTHQRRYDTLNQVLLILQGMTSREFEGVKTRITQPEPPTLF